MIRHPPRSTRTDTLFPYTLPFRSQHKRPIWGFSAMPSILGWPNQNQPLTEVLISGLFDGNSDLANHQFTALIDTGSTKTCITRTVVETLGFEPFTRIIIATPISEERRIGNECVSTCSARCWR